MYIIIAVPLIFWTVFLFHFNDYNDKWRNGLLISGLICTAGLVACFITGNTIYVAFLAALIIMAIVAYLKLQLYGF